ncbi:MAG: CaiB/BaiF CoA-transferase family protein [Bacteroides sp.]|jgi:crotonobetainyl-CoA:carnitine CoA-transferase CaiB-like acyl-CoA transferase|nr:CaiB/BaiF CoA-transferase family protein [Bacteroides sp.]
MNNELPLSGIKVLELAAVLAGPSVGMFLAELGAQVLKVENVTTRGDVTRNWKLPKEPAESDISGYFSCVNWGKSSFAADLCQPEGLELIYKLTQHCDIILVNYKPGDAEKLKVDYPTLKKHNEALIYSHITGYGLGNQRAGFDAIIQAESGFTYMNGEPGGPPIKMPVALMDLLAAHQVKEAILLALLQRERTGKGQYIEASLFRAGIASLANQATNWLVGQTIPQRMGSDHPNIVPYGTIFQTADNKGIVIAAGTDKQYRELVKALGRPELAEDPRFARNQDRVVNKGVINAIIQECIGNYKREEILHILEKKRIPAGGVFNMKEVFEVPESEPMILRGQYNSGMEIKGVRSVAFSTSDPMALEQLSPPPHYGEHTRQILEEWLKLTESEIDNLINKGVVYARKD